MLWPTESGFLIIGFSELALKHIVSGLPKGSKRSALNSNFHNQQVMGPSNFSNH